MEKIRVNSGISIEVNDNGDCITINADDQGFIERYYGIIEKMEDVSARAEALKSKEMTLMELVKWQNGEMKVIMAELDNVFGLDACKKIFGDIIPSPYALADFFEQIEPIVKTYIEERQKKITSKYSRTRKGGVKNV